MIEFWHVLMMSAFERISILSDYSIRKASTDLYQIRTFKNRPCQLFFFLQHCVASFLPPPIACSASLVVSCPPIRPPCLHLPMAVSHFLSVLYPMHKIQPILNRFLLLLQQMALHFLSHDANVSAPPAHCGTAVEPHSFGKQILCLSTRFLLQASNIRTRWDIEAASNLCLGHPEEGRAWIWETVGIVSVIVIKLLAGLSKRIFRAVGSVFPEPVPAEIRESRPWKSARTARSCISRGICCPLVTA